MTGPAAQTIRYNGDKSKMNTSEQIDKLAEALAAAQGEIKAATKDAQNPFFKSSYATLDSVWNACRESLSKHGLAVVQVPMMDQSELRLVTRLCHASGQWIEGNLILKPSKDDLQGIGSAITYGRRYMLGAMVGVATDADDDGNEATTQGRNQKPPQGKSESKQDSKKTGAKVENKDDLLKIVNSVDRVNGYFKSTNHLQNAIAKGLGVEKYEWPAKNDIEGWRVAYATAKDYAVSAAEMDQTTDQTQPLFELEGEEKAANGAYAN
jgi:hypothetical protein